MTEKEAMFILMLAKSRVSNDELTEALDKAIKALENQKSLEEELEKIRNEAYSKSCYIEWDNRGSTYVQLCLLNRIIDNHISELKGE